MIRYKCNDCEREFDEDEIAHWKESRGEFWGQPCFEEMCGCPFCHSGDIEEINEDEDDQEREDDDL